MAQQTTTLLAEQAALLATRAQALSAGESESLVAAVMGSTDADLLAFHASAFEVLKLAEAAVVAAAGEVARRSESGLPDGLARRSGEKNAAALLAARTGQHEVDAAVHCRVGLALTQREGLTGEVLPSFFPILADALATGQVTVRAGKAIVGALEKIEPHATAEESASAEEFLVTGAAKQWSAKTLQDVCRVLPDRFDQDGVEPREQALRRQRGIRKRLLESGLIEYLIHADPESAAYLDAALDARVAPRRSVRFVDVDDPSDSGCDVDPDSDFDPARVDHRSWEQKRLDALVDLARGSLRHDDGDIGGVDTTAVIHVSVATLADAEALADGTSSGTDLAADFPSAVFEGTDTPVSAATARRVVSCADIIAVVLDGEGQPLQLGSTKRFFTPGQRRAMAARDGGCVWPGCDAPPKWCDAAHIDPWAKTRRTDIDNGVLLCHFHHRRFDEDGWVLQVVDGTPWFTPPSHVDAFRTPRRGGRVRLLAT